MRFLLDLFEESYIYLRSTAHFWLPPSFPPPDKEGERIAGELSSRVGNTRHRMGISKREGKNYEMCG
jgi:hypothetical protein